MSRFAKTMIIIGLVLALMLLLTFASPDIKAFATELSKTSKLPIWLVGLAAPLLFLFNRLGSFFSGLLGGPTEERIRERNEDIKRQVTGLEGDVQALDARLRAELEPRLQRIEAQQQQIGALQGRADALAGAVPALQTERQALLAEQERLQRRLDALAGAIQDFPGGQ
jgi:hypothetical protein